MEPSKLLESLKSFSAKKKEKNGKDSHIGAITGVVLFLVSLVGMFVFAWISSRRSRELAKLRHEKNVRSLEIANKVATSKVEKNDELVSELKLDVSRSKNKIAVIDGKIEELEKVHQKDKEAIDAISGWDDI